nr:MAG TPA: hypothetical protein [Caudoviricetes sp.]DAY86193.1 MAG TPA: hypothetical protein [Caudoviricetes sp.]
MIFPVLIDEFTIYTRFYRSFSSTKTQLAYCWKIIVKVEIDSLFTISEITKVRHWRNCREIV